MLYVLDGSVRKSGGRLRVATRLIRAKNGYVVWSKEYDRPFGDVLLVFGQVLHSLDHRRHFQLLADFPVDELLDVGVVEVEADHLGGTAGGAAGLDGAGGAVADLEKGHEPRGLATAGELFVLAAEL